MKFIEILKIKAENFEFAQCMHNRGLVRDINDVSKTTKQLSDLQGCLENVDDDDYGIYIIYKNSLVYRLEINNSYSDFYWGVHYNRNIYTDVQFVPFSKESIKNNIDKIKEFPKELTYSKFE